MIGSEVQSSRFYGIPSLGKGKRDSKYSQDIFMMNFGHLSKKTKILSVE